MRETQALALDLGESSGSNAVLKGTPSGVPEE
jgi:hypothetical protein